MSKAKKRAAAAKKRSIMAQKDAGAPSQASGATQKRADASPSTRKSSAKKKPASSARRKGAPAKTPKWWWIAGSAGVVILIIIGVVLALNAGGRATPEATPVAEAPPPANLNMPANPVERNGMYAAPPPLTIDPAKQYIATIETEKGNIVAELYADRVPNTVNNFVFLAREGFYDNTTFHRVITDFMAQAGDPTGTGMGGPGYQFADEFDPTLTHDGPGILSMANAGPGTNGSQFFITYAATPWLDGGHSVFGRVTEGLDVLYSISLRDPQRAATPGDLIRTIRIEER